MKWMVKSCLGCYVYVVLATVAHRACLLHRSKLGEITISSGRDQEFQSQIVASIAKIEC